MVTLGYSYSYCSALHANGFCRCLTTMKGVKTNFVHDSLAPESCMLYTIQGQWFSGGDYRVYLLGNPVSSYTLYHTCIYHINPKISPIPSSTHMFLQRYFCFIYKLHQWCSRGEGGGAHGAQAPPSALGIVHRAASSSTPLATPNHHLLLKTVRNVSYQRFLELVY